MRTVNEISEYFETFAPLSSAMDFDNCGLLVGNKKQSVTKVLLTLDITQSVVFEAENLGCELIISHHPVIFSPLKKLDSASVPYLLATKNISALCMHTNLDLGTEFGVNICLAKAIGIKEVQIAPLGECLFCGELSEKTDIDSLALSIKSALNCNGLRYTNKRREVKKVAVSSGAGGSNVFSAFEMGADVLVTGEIKHHEINLANALGIDISDVGHFKSEDVVILPLKEKLENRFSDIKFIKSQTYSDFISYI